MQSEATTIPTAKPNIPNNIPTNILGQVPANSSFGIFMSKEEQGIIGQINGQDSLLSPAFGNRSRHCNTNEPLQVITQLVQAVNQLVSTVVELFKGMAGNNRPKETAIETPAGASSPTSTPPSGAASPNTQNSEGVQQEVSNKSSGAENNSAKPEKLPATGNFLWKPTAQRDGNLVVLLPTRFNGQVHSVKILSPDGTKELAQGKYGGIANGQRSHFRFSKPGSAFPDGAVVEVSTNNGKKFQVKVPETSKRFAK